MTESRFPLSFYNESVMRKEDRFYNALKDILIGARIEGKSGYINLMRIKSRYYEKGVFPKLQEDKVIW